MLVCHVYIKKLMGLRKNARMGAAHSRSLNIHWLGLSGLSAELNGGPRLLLRCKKFPFNLQQHES